MCLGLLFSCLENLPDDLTSPSRTRLGWASRGTSSRCFPCQSPRPHKVFRALYFTDGKYLSLREALDGGAHEAFPRARPCPAGAQPGWITAAGPVLRSGLGPCRCSPAPRPGSPPWGFSRAVGLHLPRCVLKREPCSPSAAGTLPQLRAARAPPGDPAGFWFYFCFQSPP